MIISYSLIIVLMLAALTLVVSHNYSEDLKLDEINYENQIIKRVADYSDANIESARNILNQIYLSNDRKKLVYDFLGDSGNENTFDYYNRINMLKSMFDPPVTAKTDLIDIILYKCNTREMLYFTGTERAIDETFDLNSYPWFAHAGDDYGVMRLAPSYIPGYIKNDNRPVYSVYAGFMDAHASLAGVIVFNFDARSVQKSYSEYRNKVKGRIMVTDAAGAVIFDSMEEYYGRTYPYFFSLKNSSDYIRLEDESVVVLKKTNNNLIAVGIVPRDQILLRINPVIRTIYLIMALCIAISVILVYLLSTQFSRRVGLIKNAMTDVEMGNLKKRIPPGKGNDEIEQINRKFNKMCERLESYIEKVLLVEIKAKDAQLTALQTQINPHFLYNTLETIRMQAIANDDEDVSDMIYILANLFRNSIKNGDMVVTVEEEIDYCKAYLQLHKLRLGDRLDVAFDIDDSIRDCAMLKLILQPLIENSLIYSGINSQLSSMSLEIKGSMEAGAVSISVLDNGAGIEPNELERLRDELKTTEPLKSNSSIGLRNINDRIRIIFGNEYGLDISSQRDVCTKVTVKLPACSIEEVRKRVQDINR